MREPGVCMMGLKWNVSKISFLKESGYFLTKIKILWVVNHLNKDVNGSFKGGHFTLVCLKS